MRLTPSSPVSDDAEFDTKHEHRYWLSRALPSASASTAPPRVGLVIALNPSKAGATDNDPTVRKWLGFAARWGWTGFWAGNLFSYIETESAKLRHVSYYHAIGDQNDLVLNKLIMAAPEIVLCWGNNVPEAHKRRIGVVLDLVKQCKRDDATVSCLGLTAQGAPWHVLRLGYDTPLVKWEFKEKANRRD